MSKSLNCFRNLVIGMALLLTSACGAAVQQLVPTDQPTATATRTPNPTDTPDPDSTATPTFTRIPDTPIVGATPTPLFGPTAIAQANPQAQQTRVNPNAPRIEFFTTDASAVAPGSPVNLFWSTRNATSATIYRLVNGVRNQVFNVGPDGSLSVQTRRSDRGALEFLLSVGGGAQISEQTLLIPLACPDTWFFAPAPDACPSAPAQETTLIEQNFERGRMVYIQSADNVFALFNDGRAPAWITLSNRYDAAIHPEFEPAFNPAPPLVQPLRILGFVWRGNDTVRNRLGLGIQPEFSFTGFVQTAVQAGNESIYASSADGAVLHLLPAGEVWQIITPP